MAKTKSGVPKFGARRSSTVPMRSVPVAPRMKTRGGKGGRNVRLGR